AGARIIPLSFHVDYWNDLGWSDPFSSREFTDRQYFYGRVLGQTEVYTPQMVVAGRSGFVGDETRDRNAIVAAAGTSREGTSAGAAQVESITLALSLVRPPGAATISEIGVRATLKGQTGNGESEPDDLMLALTEDNLVSKVAK